MGGSYRGGLVALLAGLGACQSPHTGLDLRTNPELYRSPGYRARMACDRAVFVAPLVDQRAESQAFPLAEAAGPYPIQWMPDGRWDRSLVEMIEDIALDEIRDSGVFLGIQKHSPPDAEALVLKLYLTAARCGAQENPAGRRSLAEVGIRAVVYGPDEGRGKRAILWDRAYREVASSDVAHWPVPAPNTLGIALRQTMAKLVSSIDQSNVARSGIPIDADHEPGR